MAIGYLLISPFIHGWAKTAMRSMKSMLRWDDLRLFLMVATEGSLSAAARRLRLGQPTVSRRMHELELQVGESLFSRLSQGSPLTLAGQRLLPAAQRMAEWAAEAQANLSPGSLKRAQGTVRIAAPPGIAAEMLLPLAARLRVSHADLQIQLLAGVEILNLTRGEADLALRTHRPSDPDLEILDQVGSSLSAYAAPSYIARLPAKPRIAQIDWIAWAPAYEHLQLNRDLQARIPDFKPAFTADDFLILIAACRAGVGALLLARGMMRRTLPQELVEIPLAPALNLRAELFLVAHKRHRQLGKLQPVIAAIREEFEDVRRGAKHDSRRRRPTALPKHPAAGRSNERP
jgi:DNA-binding transcriptional LysR family regulator